MLTDIDIVDVYDRVVVTFTLGADVCFVAFGPVWSRWLTFLCLIVFNLYFWRIINITYSKSNPSHPYDLILVQFKPFSFVCYIWIFIHDIPEFLFRISIYTLHVYLTFVIYPVTLLKTIIVFWFLIHNTANLTGFLVFFVEIHGWCVQIMLNITIFCRQSNNYFLVFIRSWPLSLFSI